MKVLLTGCAGFIGSKTTQLLLAEDHEVVGVDSLNTAYDVRLKEWRLSQLTGQPSFSFHHVDISDQASAAELFRTSLPIDAVINLAARAANLVLSFTPMTSARVISALRINSTA